MPAIPAKGPVALVFGREDSGLPNEIVDRVHAAGHDPDDRSHVSLNLAQAALIALYELHLAAGDATRAASLGAQDGAAAQTTKSSSCSSPMPSDGLNTIEFFKTRNAEHIMRSLRRHRHAGAIRIRASCRSFARCSSRSYVSSSAPGADRDATRLLPVYPPMPFRRFFDKSARKPAAPEADPETDAEEPEPATTTTSRLKMFGPNRWTRSTGVGVPMRCCPSATSTGSKRTEALVRERRCRRPHALQTGDRLPRLGHRRDRVRRLHDGARLRRARVRGAEHHARRHRDDLERTMSRALSRCSRSMSPSGCARHSVRGAACSFSKTGAEAMAAAVRIARTYTGRDACDRLRILRVARLVEHDAAGPCRQREAMSRPSRSTTSRPSKPRWPPLASHLAAIVLEPVIERLPSPEWIARAREVCDATGAALVFDEIKTGFRLRRADTSSSPGVTPDLATFGKAMANGYPLAAVVGRARTRWKRRATAGSRRRSPRKRSALAAALGVLELARSGGDLRVARVDRTRSAAGCNGRHQGQRRWA